MIVVKVELWSAITHQVSEIARMEICNDGTSDNPRRGDYTARTLRGRKSDDFTRRTTQREGAVTNYPRLAVHVWNLVAKSLAAMEYGA